MVTEETLPEYHWIHDRWRKIAQIAGAGIGIIIQQPDIDSFSLFDITLAGVFECCFVYQRRSDSRGRFK